jgi:hypothetical protein
MPIDEAMADGVGYAIDYVKGYMADNPKAMLYMEHEVHYGRQIGINAAVDPDDELAYGTSDVIIDNYPKELIVLDYKHGVGVVVSVKDNTQLRLYAAGMRQGRGRYQRYRSVVVQPRVPRRKPVQEASITDKELAAWLADVVTPAAELALSSGAPRKAGDHCRYCAADGNCPAQFKRVQELASKEFRAPLLPKGLTPAELAQMLDLLKTLSAIAEATKKHAIEAVHAGVVIPGYRKSWTPSRRVWLDEVDADQVLARAGLSKDERYKTEIVSPAEAEKLLKAKSLWPKKQRGVKTQMTPLDDVLAYTEGNPAIEKSGPEA